MHWRSFLASALVGSGLGALGCESEESYYDSCGYRGPAVLHTIESAGRGDAPEVRAQAPDNEPSILVAQLQKPPTGPLAAPDAGTTAARVRAKVNGEAILDEELRAATFHALRGLDGLREPERTNRQTEIITQALNTLIEREVVLQDALKRFQANGSEKNLEKVHEMAAKEFEKSWKQPLMDQLKVKTDDEFKVLLKAEGMTLEMQKRLWERNFMAQQYLQSRVYPLVEPKLFHMPVMEYYNSHPEEFKLADEVQWQGLFVDASRHASRDAAKRFAEVLAQRVRNHEDFAKLSEQFDDGDSKYRKGEGIGRKRGDIKPPDLEPVLFALREGDVVVHEQLSGFHVVCVVKRQNAGLMPFDEKTQKVIRDKLRNEVMERETKRIVMELKRQAVIEVFK